MFGNVLGGVYMQCLLIFLGAVYKYFGYVLGAVYM
jgi:hypothetical protein